jgi:RHS repeat-associated protein
MSKRELRRLGRCIVGASVSCLAIGGLLVEVPPVQIERAVAEAAQAVEQEQPPPIPPGDRLPVPAYPEENVIHDPEAVLPVDLPNNAAPEEMVADLTPFPALGGPNFDVYGAGPKARPHVATVFPGVVNFEDADGGWRDLPTEFDADASGGWTANAFGVDLHFSAKLSGATPVELTFPEGKLLIRPSGASGAGTSDGPTVTYPDVLPATDVVYGLNGGGYVEEVVLKDASAAGISYDLNAPGLDLELETATTVVVSDAGKAVATLTVPVAFDAAQPAATTVPSLALDDIGEGNWRLDVTVDPDFLAKAVYPVTIDPTITTTIYDDMSGVHDDTYVDLSAPTSSFADATRLKISGSTSATKNSFMYFNTTALERAGIVVYNDTEVVNRFASGGSGSGTIQVRQVTSAWESPMTWNNQSTVSTDVVDSHFSTNWLGWWFWDVAPLYQKYLDTRPQYNQPNHGIRLSTPDTGLSADVYSAEGSGLYRPRLTLVYNNLPGPPILDLPAEGFVSENDSPTLKVKGGADWPTDPDGESVLVQIQISDDPNLFTGSHLKWSSGFSDERAFVVPTGILVDGNTYYWRAQSWDVCVEPALMCATNNVDLNVSATRSLQISLKHFGDDPRYAMWSHDAGNGMTIKVNEANGNLFLDVPFDSLATAIGDLDVGLTYNSQQNVDYGLSGGWSLDMGPGSSKRDLPVELVQLATFPDAGIKIRLRGQRALYFPHRERKVFASVGPGSGVVKQNADGTFLWTAADGGQYEFNGNGKLLRADPVAASAAHGDYGFDYAYNGQGELQSVTDPLGRAVTIDWVANRPDTLTTWTGETWTFTYAGGRLASVAVDVTNPSTAQAQQEKVAFEYNGAGNVSEVDNGVTKANDRTGWLVNYVEDPTGLRRVSTVTAPPGLASTTPTPWTFEYYGPYIGTTATYACITDPLGTPGGASCNAVHQTKVDFNTSGLPIGITGPADQTGYLPVTTLIWDSNNNLVCRRTPAANAAALIQWNPAQPTACQDDSRSTKYNYRNQEPFQLLSERFPAPNSSGSGNRRLITYDYDRDTAGANFNGLWAELYENKDLRGVPKDSVLWGDMDESWGTGAPPGLTSTDNFSLRWSGLLDVSDFPTGSNPGRKVAFRLTTADEGAGLVVGNSMLLDCLGTTQPPGTYNCGTNQDVKKRLLPGLRPITIEYSDLSGNASFKLEWDQGTGTWQVLPAWRLQMNLGLLTKQTLSYVSGGSTTDVLETKYTFDTDWAKARRLPSEVGAKDLASTENRRTTFTYNQYGQVLTTTTAAGTSEAATTTNVWTNNATTSCLTQVTDPTDAVTNFTCNGAGDVTQVSQVIRAVASQPAQTRITDTQYDDLGRVTKIAAPSGGYTQTSYDQAGRPISVTRNLGTGAGHDPTATWTNAYDDAGHLLTETLPRVLDPATGQLAQPVITHTWDWLDDETQRVDVRGKTWTYVYDALRRLARTTSPSGLITETEYRLKTGTSYDHKVTTWTPPGASGGVATVSTRDVLGRETQLKTGTLDATTYAYDGLDRLTQVTDPASVVTTFTYNAYGQTKTRVDFQTSTTPATTTYTYDPAGRLDVQDGPRTDVTDSLTYDYDLAGRLTSATQNGITLPGGGTGVSTTYTYDDAGERVRISQPLTSTLTQVRDWTFDDSGRPASYVDAKGTTAYTYGPADWLEQVSDPRGFTLRFEYDNLGRRTRRYKAGPSDDQTYTYDQAGNMLTATVVASSTTITLDYDNDGRMQQVYQASYPTPTTTYVYDATTGRLSSITDPAGTTTFSLYDANGLLKEITDPFSATKVIYTHDSEGRVTKRTDGGSLCLTQTYESLTGRLDSRTIKSGGVACNGSTRASFNLDYDRASDVTRRVETVTGNTFGGTYDYTYDGSNRLATVTGPAAFGSRTYGYDGGGNRTSLQVNADPGVTTTYDSAGLPVSSSDGTTYSHDAVGNLTTIDRTGGSNDWFFTYSPWNQLTKAERSPGSADVAYTLDALDRVLSRASTGATSDYTYQGTGETLAKSSASGSTSLYAHTPAGPLAQRIGTTTRYYLRDFHGDLVGFSDTAGALQGTGLYDPWGELLSGTGDMATVPTNGAFRFQSDLTDSATGQVDMLARLYEPTLGRFSSQDALLGEPADPLSLNQYMYGLSSPVTYDDPTGLCADPDICPPQVGFGTTQTHSHEFVRQIDEAGERFEAAQEDVPPPRVEVQPASVYYQVLRNPEASDALRRMAADALISYYGTEGEAIVLNWVEAQLLGSETSTWSQITNHFASSWTAGRDYLLRRGITLNVAVCVGVCLSVGTGGISIGAFGVGPGKGMMPKRGLGASAYATFGTPPSQSVSAVGCYGVCAGGYKNLDSPGGGWIFGIGTPGIFLGGSVPVSW